MNWLFDALSIGPPNLNEPLVDCNNCRLHRPLTRQGDYSVESKCCEFSPYWSSFAIGAWLKDGNSLRDLEGIKSQQLLVTKIGIMHSVAHRKDETSLCHHFNREKKNCSIWHHRPPTCFTFFCASQHSLGIKQYGMLEDWILSIEAAALKLYFKKENFPDDVWARWSDYMEQKPLTPLPSELEIEIDRAESHFRDSHSWFVGNSDCTPLKTEIKRSWDQRFKGHPYF